MRNFMKKTLQKLRNFYMNDMLKRFPTAEETITVIQQVKDLCSNEGFKLTKFISKNTTLLKSIPDDSRRTQLLKMKYKKGYTWVYNKTYGETFNKTWITFNSM